MTQPAFEQALAQITYVAPIRRIDTQSENNARELAIIRERLKPLLGSSAMDTTSLRAGLGILSLDDQTQLKQQYGFSESLGYGAVFLDGPVKVAQLISGKPGFANALTRQGFTPEMTVTLNIGLVLTIECPGKHIVPTLGGDEPILHENQTIVQIH
jgi:hypothetical protein